ncbi:hypothetical protein MSAN_00847900 [Mycena sanguinolenta]|uniref:Secreted protein n=1 Tax=Mycena sanguinolenta TaxID=230812 RepID=A0A8H6Z1Y1_9AGAR|nr:hypothetical protein MSAN_00847900 [Mycena sanguinolenta]
MIRPVVLAALPLTLTPAGVFCCCTFIFCRAEESDEQRLPRMHPIPFRVLPPSSSRSLRSLAWCGLVPPGPSHISSPMTERLSARGRVHCPRLPYATPSDGTEATPPP